MLSTNETAPLDNIAPEKTPYRLNLTLSLEAKNELEALKIKAQKPSNVDVLRAALALYKLVIEHQLEGGRVIFRHADGSEEGCRFL